MSKSELRGLERSIVFLWILQVSFVVFLIGLGVLALVSFDLVPSSALVLPVVLEGLGCVHALYRYRNWCFELREDHLFLDHGVLKRTRSMVPYVRVQHVDTQRGPLRRILGLSKVVVYTAGSKGADVTIPGLSKREASDVQEKLRDLAIESDDLDGV